MGFVFSKLNIGAVRFPHLSHSCVCVYIHPLRVIDLITFQLHSNNRKCPDVQGFGALNRCIVIFDQLPPLFFVSKLRSRTNVVEKFRKPQTDIQWYFFQ